MSEELPKLTDFPYGLIAITASKNPKMASILHFCGYMHPPTEDDIKTLELELDIDEEFGLVGRINKDVFVVVAPKDIVERCTTNAWGHNVKIH